MFFPCRTRKDTVSLAWGKSRFMTGMMIVTDEELDVKDGKLLK